MSQSVIAHILHRAHKLGRMLDKEMSRPNASALQLMRLKALQLRVQSRLASVLGVHQPEPRPIRVRVDDGRPRPRPLVH